MKIALELPDSRINAVVADGQNMVVAFSHAYIHKSKGIPGKDPGSGWSREAELIMQKAIIHGPAPIFPNTISDGKLIVGGITYDALIPLPFKRRGLAVLNLSFSDGSVLEIIGLAPRIELIGKPIYLEELK